MSNIEFTKEQKDAVMDLLVVGMYADGHVASAEDERIGQLLNEYGVESEHERRMLASESIGRASQHAGTTEKKMEFAKKISALFEDRPLRVRAYELLEGMVASDAKLSEKEKAFLSLVRDAFDI